MRGQMIRAIRSFIVPGVAALSAVMLASSYLSSEPARAGTSAEPIDIVRRFVGDPSLDVVAASPAPNPPGVRAATFVNSTDGHIFTVDLDQQQVVDAAMPPQNRGTPVDRDRAYAIAQEFGASRVQGFDRLVLVSGSAAGTHGQSPTEFNFLWAEQLGPQRAKGLQRVAISVDAGTGSVVNFMQVPAVRVSVSTEPGISREQALAIAITDFAFPVTNSSSELQVWWRDNDRSKEQVLRWYITLENSASPDTAARGAVYVVDAHTGLVLDRLN